MAMADYLPHEVLCRKKSPYPKTFDPRYTKLVAQRIENLVQDVRAPIFQLVSRSGIRNLLEKDQPWPWYGQLMRTPQTMAYFLQLDFWLRHYRVEFLF